MLFANTPRRRRHSPAFATSAVLHCAVFAVLGLQQHADPPKVTAASLARKYSIRFIRLQPPEASQQEANQQGEAQAPRGGAAEHGSEPAPGQEQEAADSKIPNPALERRRQFELPATVHVNAVNQTLIQLDRPPDLVLKQEMPIPNLMLWADQPVPMFLKQFVTPPVKPVTEVAQNLPPAPKLELPNLEASIADLKVAAVLLNNIPQLVRPAATTFPIRIPAPDLASQIPQTVLPAASGPAAPALISLSDFVMHRIPVIVLPPANQAAAAASSTGAGSTGLAGGRAAQGDAAHGGGGTSTGGAATGMVGITRITHPKAGKFGAVVLGSTPSTPYDEEGDPLSGKVVYTVYVDVGLRKRWILEYCLARAAERSNGMDGSAAVLDAPWPFLIARPDGLTISDADYIVIHGTITAQGRFIQLALLSPQKLEQKDALLSSLRYWEFRPASRGGEPTAVEALLIIPSQSE